MDKIARAHQFAPILELGVIYIPESHKNPNEFTSWSLPMIDQMEKFPNAAHDDIQDTVSQAFIYLRDSKLLELPYTHVIDDEVEVDYSAQSMGKNPYAM
jgi:phage terminase large subunit-like protein